MLPSITHHHFTTPVSSLIRKRIAEHNTECAAINALSCAVHTSWAVIDSATVGAQSDSPCKVSAQDNLYQIT